MFGSCYILTFKNLCVLIKIVYCPQKLNHEIMCVVVFYTLWSVSTSKETFRQFKHSEMIQCMEFSTNL